MLAVGCKTSSKKLNELHLGMTAAQVVKILGEPESMAETHEGKTLFYSLTEMHVGFVPYSVKLVNGKVDSYGRDGAAPTAPPVPMPVVVPVMR